AMLMRLIDFLKMNQITALFTNLTSGSSSAETTDIGVSSLMDTWLLLRDIELNGERNRGLYVLKSRGTAHSNQIREFLITSEGVQLQDEQQFISDRSAAALRRGADAAKRNRK